MDFTRYYHLAFAHHRIMNPLSEDLLRLIGQHTIPGPGATVLDIGSGKGYASLLFARDFAAQTTQVDVSEQWTEYARRLFDEQGLARQTEIHTMDADTFLIEPRRYRLILCFGTTPVYGGFSEALSRLRDGLCEGGSIAVGEISCEGSLPKRLRDYLYHHEWRIYQMKELLNAIADQGFDPMFAFRSTEREWDTYMGLQWKAIGDFARHNPKDPDAVPFARYMEEEQEMFLRYHRTAVDWNVFLLRRR